MEALPKLIPTLVDTPASDPQLGFDTYARGIAAAILGGAPARFTVGLYGPWGTGKSSLLKRLELELEELWSAEGPQHAKGKQAPELHVVNFDAWRYQHATDLILPLLASIKEKIQTGQGAAAHTAKLVKSIEGLEVQLFGFGMGFSRSSSEANPVGQFSASFTQLTEISDRLQQDQSKIIVLVDDLDRCSPDSIVNLIEALHLLTDIDGLIFVLALDHDYLITAIEERYPNVNALRFIEKIIQVPFRIPLPYFKMERIEQLIPDWQKNYASTPFFRHVDSSTIETIAQVALRSNPRQVKRLLNTFMLARHMRSDETGGGAGPGDSGSPSTRLLKLLGMQLAWPEQYDELHAEIQRRIDAEEEPTTALEALESYKRFVAASSESGDLGEPGEPEETSAESAQEQSRPDGGTPLPADPRLRRETNGDAESLSVYLAALLPGDTPIASLISLMDLTEQAAAPQPGETSTRTVMEKVLYDSDNKKLQDRYEQVLNEALRAAGGEGRAKIKRHNTYTAVYLTSPTGGRDRIAVCALTRLHAQKILIYLPLSDEPEQKGFIRDVSQLGHHGVGDTELTLTVGENGNFAARWPEALELIEKGIRTVEERRDPRA